MPRVSVVVPVYNCASPLGDALESILDQTMTDLEVICVDDGSTDASAEVIADWAARDPRVRLIQQANAGGGAARNTGLAAATGEYVIFLDADDVFSPQLLELAAQRLDDTGADVSIHDGRPFTDHPTAGHPAAGDPDAPGVYLRRRLLPDHDPFSPADVADRALQLTSPAPWLRMYRREFVTAHRLQFRPRGVANDVGFTAEATLAARAITVVDRPLVFYRKGHGTTQSSAYDTDALAFVPSMRDLRDRVEALGGLPTFDRTLRFQCFNMIAHALRTTTNSEAYEQLHRTVHDELLAEFELENLPHGYFGIRWLDEAYLAVTTLRPTESPLHPRRRGRPASLTSRVRAALRRRLSAPA